MQKTILVADDEPEFLKTMESFLGERDYKVLLAHNGLDAYKKAAEHLPDMVLMDIMMPKMDGKKAAACMKNNPKTENIPVFFVTALNSDEQEKMGESYNEKTFTKPLKLQNLLQEIKKLI